MKKKKRKLKSKSKNSTSKVKATSESEIKPEDAIQFLEDIRNMSSHVDEPSVAISIRIPGNILRSLKLKAKAEGKKYQSLMIDYVRKG
jgi:predicted DNA binding CopG/RHH family protein